MKITITLQIESAGLNLEFSYEHLLNLRIFPIGSGAGCGSDGGGGRGGSDGLGGLL